LVGWTAYSEVESVSDDNWRDRWRAFCLGDEFTYCLDFSSGVDNLCCLFGVVWISSIDWANITTVGDWENPSVPLIKSFQSKWYSWDWLEVSVRVFKRGMDDKLSSCVLVEFWVGKREFLYGGYGDGMFYMI